MISLRILLTYTLVVLAVSGALVDQPPTSGNTDKLDSFVQSEAVQSCDNDHHKLMDKLALKLLDGIMKDSNKLQLLRELKDAVNVEDLLKASEKIISVKVNQPNGFVEKQFNKFEKAPGGLLDVLGGDNNSKHIVNANRQLSIEALKELNDFAKSGSVSTADFIKFYSDPRWNKNYRKQEASKAISEKVQSVKSFLIESFDKGADAIEKLYMTASFLEQIPVIGQQVTILKRQGQFTYDIIRTIKSLKSFIENYQKGQRVEIKLTGEGKQMLSQIGINALKSVALNLLRSRSGSAATPTNISEVASRTAYYLLIQYAPKAGNCARKP